MHRQELFPPAAAGWASPARRGVLASTAVLLATSLLPWYGIDWVVLDAAGERVEHSRANVWQFSTAWSLALAVSAGAGLWWLRQSPPGEWAASRAAGLATLAPLLILLWCVPSGWAVLWPEATVTVARLESGSGGDRWAGPASGLDARVIDPSDIGVIHREVPFVFHADGYHADLRIGFYLGIVALVAHAVVLRQIRRARFAGSL